MDDQTNVQKLIARITSSKRMRSSAHFSDALYRDEPILTTGRQMATYLPDAYREMRAMSRWQEGSPHGRWLTEAELFYCQGMFMADFEDDCPYRGTFKAYYPTYSAMSDRQLRGYFTWRASVRHGDIQQTSLSFVYVYLYELLCGIGVRDPLDGFTRLRDFWQVYREFEPKIDRYVRVWQRDYVVYHGLDPALLDEDPVIIFDQALFRLAKLSAPFDPAVLESIDVQYPNDAAARSDSSGAASLVDARAAAPGGTAVQDAEMFGIPASAARSGKRGARSALPLPPDTAREDALLQAMDALSTYRIRLSRLYKDHPDDLRHVACAVYVRLLDYYRRHRSHGLIESMFGELASMPYTMFASAIFFDRHQHAPGDYELDPIHRYRCREGQWQCMRVYGARGKSSKLGTVLRTIDAALRKALDFPHPLKEQEAPKYLRSMIDREIAAWLTWKTAHAPRRIDIDLSQLSSIRSAADEVREALLTDEEREDAPTPAPMAKEGGGASAAPKTVSNGSAYEASAEAMAEKMPSTAPKETSSKEAPYVSAPGDIQTPCASAHLEASSPIEEDVPATPVATGVTVEASGADASVLPGTGARAGSGAQVAAAPGVDRPMLSDTERTYLAGLLSGMPQTPEGISEDMLVDAINETLFDLVGDTVIEFSAEGAQIIEDYEDDIREVLAS